MQHIDIPYNSLKLGNKYNYIDYIEQVIQLSVLFEKNNLKVITKHLKNDLLLLLIKFIRELDVNKEIIDEIFTDNVVRQTMMS